jgi:hypothetical protein
MTSPSEPLSADELESTLEMELTQAQVRSLTAAANSASLDAAALSSALALSSAGMASSAAITIGSVAHDLDADLEPGHFPDLPSLEVTQTLPWVILTRQPQLPTDTSGAGGDIGIPTASSGAAVPSWIMKDTTSGASPPALATNPVSISPGLDVTSLDAASRTIPWKSLVRQAAPTSPSAGSLAATPASSAIVIPITRNTEMPAASEPASPSPTATGPTPHAMPASAKPATATKTTQPPQKRSWRTAAAAAPIAATVLIAVLSHGVSKNLDAPSPAQTRPAPPATPFRWEPPAVAKEPTVPDPPLLFKNPFDSGELFVFPAGTTADDARDTVAAMLLERARDRQPQRLAKRQHTSTRAMIARERGSVR